MGLGCGAKFYKYCLFGFNLIFVIAGLVCLGVGIWLVADKHAIDTMDQAVQRIRSDNPNVVSDYKGMPNAVRNLGIVLAAGGAVILVIAFLGCCGAVKEWRPMLVLYAIFLMVILAVEIAAAIYAAVNRGAFENDIKKSMAESLRAYGGNDSYPNAVRTAWDVLMNGSQCCGIEPNFEDKHRGFEASIWFKDQFKVACPTIAGVVPYPMYCCSKDLLTKAANTITPCPGYQYCVDASVYSAGCYEKFKGVAENKMSIIIGVGVAVGLIQLIGILFAFCLCCAISQDG